MRLKSLDRLRGHPLFMSAHLRAGAVSRTEYASGAAGDCPQSMESAVLRAFEDASRTREGCFWHRISLPYRRRLFFAPSVSENASRTPGALFSHRMHIPYTRGHSPVPNANAKKEKGSGANKESGVRVRGSRFLHRMPLKTRRVPEASCCRCRTSNLSKQEAGQKKIFSRPLICYGLLRSVGLCG